jgi:NAD(P)H-hydrate epimerase
MADAVLFGCGLGTTERTAQLLSLTLRRASQPVVIDADGLNALGGNIHLLKEARAPLILTPHPGEMARLCGLSVREVQANRAQIAIRFASHHKVCLVLKGHGTLIAAPDGGLILNETGGPGLARGGSGDLLAGMIASLLAQGMTPRAAAACGAFLHGMAADRTAERLSQTAMLPRDVLDDLAGIFAEYGR